MDMALLAESAAASRLHRRLREAYSDAGVPGFGRSTRVFVAGHEGLLGRALVRALARRGEHDLLVARRRSLDLTQLAAVESFFADVRPDFVFLAAGRVGGIAENRRCPAELAHVNLALQTSVLEAARRTDVRGLLLFGSSCMYPRDCPQPMLESALGSGPLEPTSRAYASAKLAGVELCRAYRNQYQRRFFAMVPATLYGPHDHFGPRGHVIPQLLARFHAARRRGAPSVCVLGSGRPRREFLHVDDAAEAAIFLMELDAELDVVNVSCGEDVSILELAELVREVVGFAGAIEFDPSQPDGAPRKLLDVSQLHALGFRARTPLRRGLEESYRWFIANCPEDPPSPACS
jgi:GDP-L-fucose synthase